jgi:hypothetical protein
VVLFQVVAHHVHEVRLIVDDEDGVLLARAGHAGGRIGRKNEAFPFVRAAAD